MAGNLEQIILEILLKDRASEGLGRTSGAARLAGENVGALNKKLDEVSRKTAEARVKLAGDKEAQAALDKLDTKLLGLDRRTANPRITVEGAARALAEITAVDAELDKLGGKGGTAEAATSALGAGGLAGPGGLGALIGAGVALSPVIATLGVGLAGFGLAAAGVAKPIADAAGKTGGLAKNMKLLDPEQRAVARGILDLGKQYGQFQKTLKPEVLGAFGEGLSIAGHLLHDIQPVAVATGKALNIMLSRIDAEFASGEWQQFFGFMAKNAGPDMALLGNLFVDLAKDIPPLLTQLQPLAEGFLKDADAVLKLVNAGTQAVAWEHQHAAALSNSTGWLGRFEHAAVQAFGQMFPGVKAAKALQDQLGKTGGTTDSTSRKIHGLGTEAQAAAVKVQTLEQQVTGLTNAENKALSPLLAYTNAVLAQRDDAKKLADALKQSHDRIGLQTDVQRASFSAANTYIQDLLNTASAASASHRGIDTQISSIRNALPMLRNVKGGTKEYWLEVQTLVAWLHKLEFIKFINEKVHVTGSGTWTAQNIPGVAHGPQNIGAAPGGFATGGRVPGYGGGDRFPILVEGGEAIVDKDRTLRFAPLLAAMGVPGFASGGLVGWYNPRAGTGTGGLGPWLGKWNAAMMTDIGVKAASLIARAIAAAVAGFGGAGSGALGGDAGANKALAMRMFPWPMSMWAAFDYLEMREAGYNRFARNPSSGAYGIPQALPPSKMPFAAQAGGGSHAGAQLSWMYGYIRSVYGNPVNAAAHERAVSWYDQGGWLPPGATLAINGTGRPERVGGPAVVNITINVYAPTGNAAEIGRVIAAKLAAFKKAGGMIYKPGGF